MLELFLHELLKTAISIMQSKLLTKQQNLSEKIIRRELHTMVTHVFVRFPVGIAKASKFSENVTLNSNENPCPPSAIVTAVDTTYHDNFVTHVQKWWDLLDRDILFPVFATRANFVLFDVAPMTSNKAVMAFARADIFVRLYANFLCLDETFVGVPVRDMWEKVRYLAAVKCP
jgi:histidinol-phosphate/aromatic aminotransferase/cobyric acid decarboxylase-like protein